MCARGLRTLHVDTELPTQRRSLGIEIVENFHVIRHESNRSDHKLAMTLGVERSDVVYDVGF